MSDHPTSLHRQRPITELFNFIKAELDGGRIAAVTVVAVSQEKDIFRETWVAPNGAPGYSLIGGLETEKADLHERFFSDA